MRACLTLAEVEGSAKDEVGSVAVFEGESPFWSATGAIASSTSMGLPDSVSLRPLVSGGGELV